MTSDNGTPSDNESVTEWLRQMEAGDDRAAQLLWENFIHRLIGLADRKLGDAPRGGADAEDVASEVFRQFFDSARRGVFPRLNDRNDLWQVLVMLTKRRAIEQRRRTLAEKRGAGAVIDEQHLANIADQSIQEILTSGEPGVDFAEQMREQLGRYLHGLDDPIYRDVVLDKLAAFTNREIAERRGVSLRAVERKLAIVRRRWNEGENDD